MPENYPKALALHLSDNLREWKVMGSGFHIYEAEVQQALEDLGLKLVAKDHGGWDKPFGPDPTLRGGPDPEGATASRHPGED